MILTPLLLSKGSHSQQIAHTREGDARKSIEVLLSEGLFRPPQPHSPPLRSSERSGGSLASMGWWLGTFLFFLIEVVAAICINAFSKKSSNGCASLRDPPARSGAVGEFKWLDLRRRDVRSDGHQARWRARVREPNCLSFPLSPLSLFPQPRAPAGDHLGRAMLAIVSGFDRACGRRGQAAVTRRLARRRRRSSASHTRCPPLAKQKPKKVDDGLHLAAAPARAARQQVIPRRARR